MPFLGQFTHNSCQCSGECVVGCVLLPLLFVNQLFLGALHFLKMDKPAASHMVALHTGLVLFAPLRRSVRAVVARCIAALTLADVLTLGLHANV